MSPDGKILYVDGGPGDEVMPNNTATSTAGTPIPGTGDYGWFGMAISPDGKRWSRATSRATRWP